MQTEALMNQDDIVEAYKDLVYRIAFTYVKNRYDADDIFQEVFITLFKKERSFTSAEHQKAWIIRVTINRCKRHFINARRNVSLDLSQHDCPTETDKDYDYLYQAILELAPRQRIIFSLYYIEELSVKEISSILQLSESNIKTILHRSRQQLKERIDFNE